MPLLNASLSDISSNARLKHYPSSTVLQVANAPIFRAAGFEPRKRTYNVPSKGHGVDHDRALASSRARACSAVHDIALCNHFDYFFTWTLDPKHIDRYDADIVGKKVQTFLRNASHRKSFSYLVVGEKHEDGAIHLHGLCNLGSVEITRAVNAHNGLPLSTSRGQPVFNMADWTLGFSTCIPIDENYERTCNYLTKYFTKDSQKVFGKWYFSSRNLIKHPDIELVDDGMDFDTFVEDNPDAPIIPIYRDVRIAVTQFQSHTEVNQ